MNGTNQKRFLKKKLLYSNANDVNITICKVNHCTPIGEFLAHGGKRRDIPHLINCY